MTRPIEGLVKLALYPTSEESWFYGDSYKKNVDLALLKLDEPIPEHLWVSLDKAISNGDSLYAFGYTDEYGEGEPRDFIYTGLTGDDPS